MDKLNCIDYLVISDFECNSGMKGFVLHEIIEFPIVIVDVKNKKIIKEFTTFVKPTYHPKLTNFIKNLTYIEQKDVDQAPTISEVFEIITQEIKQNTNDSDSTFFIFDCDSDATYLRAEINLKNLKHSPYFNQYFNLKELFDRFFNVKAKSLENMLKILNLTQTGHPHIALHDARNICQVVMCMLEKGYIFDQTQLKQVIL
ncbi:exonuclease (macronuclear) [Tetrahymena thermophila SB210]|uniref:Exonuclease n=1 Tax=Tetrahymena thermophila (strain SB210) TaxID=312017 RepID=I7LWJ7_TETTS|nr:exonuclease [Tetrahymena thermophila SB210]EAS02016.2 exonuclease [Tetrahymena thermophila SB210]|eukprot:XP_001022261.2 exonuclease [Tetrahymena thermophila SB210]